MSKRKISIGDNVAYSVQWLKSTGLSHSDLAADRGVVVDLIPIGSRFLAVIDWRGDSPPKVLADNLAIVGANRRFCNVD